MPRPTWCLAAAWAVLIGPLGGERVAAQRPVALGDLTPPADRLAPGCVLAPPGNGIGLLVAGNPWSGADRVTTGAIRERVAGRSRVPDAPMFTAGEAARFRLQLAEGIDESYVAVYRDNGPHLVVVYGLRFSSPNGREQRTVEAASSAATVFGRVTIAGIVASVQGPPGACARSLYEHLLSLGK